MSAPIDPSGSTAPTTGRRWAVVFAPLVIALVVASWLLWTRGDPARQGGYCMNASVEIAAVLQRADRSGDVGRGPLPPVDQILKAVDHVDASRFQVDTPPEIADEVAKLAKDNDPAAFAKIAEDYLTRCRHATDAQAGG